MSRSHLAAFALAAPLLIGGCGGSKSSDKSKSTAQTPSTAQTQLPGPSAPPGKPLSRSVLIAKADAICARVNARRSSIKLRSIQDYTTQLPPLAAYERASATELSRLAPPASIAKDWNRLVTDTRTIAAETLKISEYADAQSRVRGDTAFLAVNSAQRQMASIASRVGLRECGQV